MEKYPTVRTVYVVVISLIIGGLVGFAFYAQLNDKQAAVLIAMAAFVVMIFALDALQKRTRKPKDFEWHPIRGTDMALVTFRMLPDVLQILQRLAADCGLSESHIVAEAIRTLAKKNFTLVIGELKEAGGFSIATDWSITRFTTITEWQSHPGFSGGQWVRRFDKDQGSYIVWELRLDGTVRFFAVDTPYMAAA